MQRYFLRRLMLVIPTLLGVSFVVFAIVRLAPGDVLTVISGDFGASDKESRDALKKEYGLDKNIPEQYVTWLGEVARFDLGTSILSGRTVTSELKTRLPITFELGLMAIFFSCVIAIPVGIVSAIRQDTVWDYVGRSFAIGLLAAPGFAIALVLITVASRNFTWGVPPRTFVHFTDDPVGNFKMLAVPAMLLGASLSGSVMRFTRSTMLEVLRQDYIRTAWSKGLKERSIIMRHALRNAFIPVITVIGLQLPVLVGGTVIIESVYSIPGMGRYYIDAVNQKDYPVIQAINLVVALVVVFANLGVDLMYSVLDPRIRYS
jgi:peptide/nickel transport system permease protein